MSRLPDENGIGAQPAHRDGATTNASAADASGTVKFRKAQGLPLADWHDHKKASSGSALFPGAGLATP